MGSTLVVHGVVCSVKGLCMELACAPRLDPEGAAAAAHHGAAVGEVGGVHGAVCGARGGTVWMTMPMEMSTALTAIV